MDVISCPPCPPGSATTTLAVYRVESFPFNRVSVKAVETPIVTDVDPFRATLPTPLSIRATVAFCDVHVNVTRPPPAGNVVGSAMNVPVTAGAAVVVKLRAALNALVPELFFAFTRQKYLVP